MVSLSEVSASPPVSVGQTRIVLLQPRQLNGKQQRVSEDEASAWSALVIPPGSSFLSLRWRLLHNTRTRPRKGPWIVVQPVGFGTSRALVVSVPDGTTICVNGVAAPRAVVLREKDELFVAGAAHVAFVTLYADPRVSPVLRDKIGTLCPVCRRPFAQADRVYNCLCGFCMHAVDPLGGAQGSSCAAMVRRCLDCHRPIDPSANRLFSYVPQELR